MEGPGGKGLEEGVSKGQHDDAGVGLMQRICECGKYLYALRCDFAKVLMLYGGQQGGYL